MTGRTTFMIAHRLSTLERCDMVLVLQNGTLQAITNTVDEARRQLLANPAEPARDIPAPRPVLVRSER